MNPLRYRPAEIAKALVTLVTSVIVLCGLFATTSTSGAMADVGAWAAGIAAFLAPTLVFLKRAEAIAEIVDPGSDGASRAPAGD